MSTRDTGFESLLHQVVANYARRQGASGTAAKVLRLTQLVSADQLGDDDEYKDILQDIEEEARKHGRLVKVVIPRPDPTGAPAAAGVGNVYLEYADFDGSINAKTQMHGRWFDGKGVVVDFYPESKYADGVYD